MVYHQERKTRSHQKSKQAGFRSGEEMEKSLLLAKDLGIALKALLFLECG